MEAPKVNETWEIKYGLTNKKTEYVKVLEVNSNKNVKNWRCHSFKCMAGKQEIFEVSGECFVRKTRNAT